MEEYITIAQSLKQIVEYVERGELALEKIPLENIIQLVRNMYEEKNGEGEWFATLYATLLSKRIVGGDYGQVIATLQLLIRHMEMISSDTVNLDKVSNEKYALQCRIGHLKNNEKIREWHERNGEVERTPFQGRGVIYSAVTGNYDDIKEPLCIIPDFDYILFTDNPQITSSVWDVRLIDNEEKLDNVRLARKIKILGHEYLPEYDYSIWVDGKLQIADNLREYIEKYRGKEPMLCFNHHISECVCHELYGCIQLGKDSAELMEQQVARYLSEGYPKMNGAIESALLVRELKDERVQQVMKTWWNEIMNASRRDQLSFNYACWKNDFVYDTTDLYIYRNKYVQAYEHN